MLEIIQEEVMMRKYDWLKTQVEFYEGELWVIEDERTLPSYAIDQLKGVAILVVFGELELDPQISPDTLTQRLDKVHNLGSIHCTTEQMAVIQSLPGSREGKLIDTSQPKPKKKREPEGDVIEESYVNSNYVRL